MNIRFVSSCWSAVMALGMTVFVPGLANAVPAFASQTGMQCASCHITGFSELTSFGRQFKLRGYALGESKLPVSGGGVLSRTSTSSADIGVGGMGLADDRAVVLQRLLRAPGDSLTGITNPPKNAG